MAMAGVLHEPTSEATKILMPTEHSRYYMEDSPEANVSNASSPLCGRLVCGVALLVIISLGLIGLQSSVSTRPKVSLVHTVPASMQTTSLRQPTIRTSLQPRPVALPKVPNQKPQGLYRNLKSPSLRTKRESLGSVAAIKEEGAFAQSPEPFDEEMSMSFYDTARDIPERFKDDPTKPKVDVEDAGGDGSDSKSPSSMFGHMMVKHLAVLWLGICLVVITPVLFMIWVVVGGSTLCGKILLNPTKTSTNIEDINDAPDEVYAAAFQLRKAKMEMKSIKVMQKDLDRRISQAKYANKMRSKVEALEKSFDIQTKEDPITHSKYVVPDQSGEDKNIERTRNWLERVDSYQALCDTYKNTTTQMADCQRDIDRAERVIRVYKSETSFWAWFGLRLEHMFPRRSPPAGKVKFQGN